MRPIPVNATPYSLTFLTKDNAMHRYQLDSQPTQSTIVPIIRMFKRSNKPQVEALYVSDDRYSPSKTTEVTNEYKHLL